MSCVPLKCACVMCDVSQFAIAEMFGETFILSCLEQSEPNFFESVAMAGNPYVP